ncbi:Sec-independent protein translocase subunit TatA/TatB [Natronogracilivirga saccharolytica]|uniref:Sec-independent protein translocase protein TatA n=1 Tax=Natronogracilivirga saccharolytica TaxID=2812953 RepID=A0A8J7UV43_9BACT|nr:twin-arginine translocase TatA/TatE family subunit [Natronogracilivirga saccharolytica]MBP3192151.1 twin-arginine translocase TatA/TatE family subunit [Natronogracilivirga saccharolytica]
MGFLGGFEWLIIIVILIFLFGARKIPDMVRGIGRGIFEFRKAVDEGKNDKNEEKESHQDAGRNQKD